MHTLVVINWGICLTVALLLNYGTSLPSTAVWVTADPTWTGGEDMSCILGNCHLACFQKGCRNSTCYKHTCYCSNHVQKYREYICERFTLDPKDIPTTTPGWKFTGTEKTSGVCVNGNDWWGECEIHCYKNGCQKSDCVGTICKCSKPVNKYADCEKASG